MKIEPECEMGYSDAQVKEILGTRESDFWKWMHGQTTVFCEGRKYNHEKKKYEPCCGGVAHGVVVFVYDVERFLAGLVPLD